MRSALCALIVLAGMPAAWAGIQTETLSYPAGDVTCKGYLAYDDTASARRPLVLVVHEWWGLGDFAKSQARRLAEIGYVAFAVDMYGDGSYTTDMDAAGKMAGAIKSNPTLMRERFEAGLNAVKGHERVDAKRVGGIGFCFGGTVCLEMARAGLDLDGVVSFHGSLKSAWPKAPASIRTLLLVCHGADDPAVPPAEVAAFQQEMAACKADCQLIAYSNTVHSFTNPDADSLPVAKYNESSARRSFQAMRTFFEEVFADRH